MLCTAVYVLIFVYFSSSHDAVHAALQSTRQAEAAEVVHRLPGQGIYIFPLTFTILCLQWCRLFLSLVNLLFSAKEEDLP